VTPLIRLTNSALRGADPEVVEAARSFGATERRVLFQVRVPLGLPTIMVGVNQTILLALAMVVVSAFIGTPGLGEEVLAGVTQAQLGRGIEAGLSMFLLALIVERIFTGAARRIGGTQAAQLVR
jgi:glycine betaine/proline transport system permease protein